MPRRLMNFILPPCLLFALPSPSRAAKWEQPFGPMSGRDEIIAKCFAGRELAPLEGIWTDLENGREIAIVKITKEEYDYTGLFANNKKTRAFSAGDEITRIKILNPSSYFARGSWALGNVYTGYKKFYPATYQFWDQKTTLEIISEATHIILVKTDYVKSAGQPQRAPRPHRPADSTAVRQRRRQSGQQAMILSSICNIDFGDKQVSALSRLRFLAHVPFSS